jgi:hypothetical protein
MGGGSGFVWAARRSKPSVDGRWQAEVLNHSCFAGREQRQDIQKPIVKNAVVIIQTSGVQPGVRGDVLGVRKIKKKYM